MADGGVFYSSCRLHGTSIDLDEDEEEIDELDDEVAQSAAFVMERPPTAGSSHLVRLIDGIY